MSTDLGKAFHEIVSNRRSVRGFTPELIAEDKLKEIFTEAQLAPSNCNVQPWKVAVVSGERCRALAGKITQAMAEGNMSMDFPYDGTYYGTFKDRQKAAAFSLFDAQGIKREDKAARHVAFMSNYDFFAAPHVAFIFLPEEFGIRESADVGMYAQTLMLSLTAHGLASCPQTALSFFANLIREELGLDASNKLLFGISFGYEDVNHPANLCRIPRAPLEETTLFFS